MCHMCHMYSNNIQDSETDNIKYICQKIIQKNVLLVQNRSHTDNVYIIKTFDIDDANAVKEIALTQILSGHIYYESQLFNIDKRERNIIEIPDDVKKHIDINNSHDNQMISIKINRSSDSSKLENDDSCSIGCLKSSLISTKSALVYLMFCCFNSVNSVNNINFSNNHHRNRKDDSNNNFVDLDHLNNSNNSNQLTIPHKNRAYKISNPDFCFNNFAEYVELFASHDYANNININMVVSYAGNDLYDYIRDENNYRYESDIKNIFSQIIKAVKWLHSLGIAHGDISLENICYNTHTRKIRVIDFGHSVIHPMSPYASLINGKYNTSRIKVSADNYDIQKLTCNIIHGNVRCGKFDCISPERFISHRLDKSYCAYKDDVYSLGVMLYNLATGNKPYDKPYDDPHDKCNKCYLFKSFMNSSWMNSKDEQQEFSKCGYSNSFMDMIDKILKYEEKRISLDDIFIHSFIKK